ncbi:multidrug transporter [Neiella marina]|uniref:Multidrug transporter n=1 Tax=Neiella marina TaxID=508461 RepID=A0A8J2XNP4_9GAMM|nr:TolC family protein [Neiella marina]GGA84638.1 multidrug transporter [Neiella marina]
MWFQIAKQACLIVGLICLIGCSSSTPSTEQLIAQSSLLAPTQWQELDDMSQSPIDFDSRWGIRLPEQSAEFLQQALRDNQSINIAIARLRQANADVQTRRAALLPDFDIRASHSHRQIDDDGNKKTRDTSSLAVTASWELDLWQRLDDLSNSAELNAKISELDWRALQLSIQGQVLSAWLDVIETTQRQALIERNIVVQQRRLALSERRLDLGLVTSVDVRNGRNTLAGLRANLSSSRIALKADKRRLQLLLAQYPSGIITLNTELPELLPLPVLNTPQSILLNRPDIQAALLGVQAAGYEVDAAEKAKLPRITFNGSYGTNQQDFADLFDLDRWLGSVTGALVQPIFYRGELEAQVERKKAAADIAKLGLEQSLLKAWLEVENNLTEEQLLAERQAHLAEALVQAKAAEVKTEQDYELGLATSFELLATQRSSINNENALIVANIARLKNRISLMLAIGIVNQQEQLSQADEQLLTAPASSQQGSAASTEEHVGA